MITKEICNTLFEYRDGELFWKTFRRGVRKSRKAGTIRGGYNDVRIDGKNYGIHRIVFLMHHGYLPIEVDHIDLNKLNNNIENLRAATHKENTKNRPKSNSNISGYKNVSWNKRLKKWQVFLKVDQKSMYFGLYFDKEVARFVADTMRHKYHGNFANHN